MALCTGMSYLQRTSLGPAVRRGDEAIERDGSACTTAWAICDLHKTNDAYLRRASDAEVLDMRKSKGEILILEDSQVKSCSYGRDAN
jgi:hypothetical protein